MQGRTVFIIAHRLATVRKCDRILVMEKGEIVESGTHEALLSQQGRYARFYAQQFS
jgi:ATP-binding cassette, subfamily B, bacterial